MADQLDAKWAPTVVQQGPGKVVKAHEYIQELEAELAKIDAMLDLAGAPHVTTTDGYNTRPLTRTERIVELRRRDGAA